MTDTVLLSECRRNGARQNAHFVKGHNPFVWTGRSRLQNERAALNQQIIKQMRMRAGAENLLRATTNSKVRDMVLLELSYVNCGLQLLMEQLEGLNSSLEVYQDDKESSNMPLIALGLKETKEVDFSAPLKKVIQDHYHEDGSSFEDEICDLMDLRQACRTPSRCEAGVKLLSGYLAHLSLLEKRFFSPTCQVDIFFTWYDSFNGVPTCQQDICLEKASVLFNMAALCSQIGTRCQRDSQAGLQDAVAAFQKAAGVLNHLKKTFTQIPSHDMSSAMVSMLVQMMLAQAQECMLGKVSLSGVPYDYISFIKMAQKAAKVGESYDQVHQSMSQSSIRDHIPVLWEAVVQVKTHYFSSLAHYFSALLLIDYKLGSSDEVEQQGSALLKLYKAMPGGCSPLEILKDPVKCRHLGRAHLHKALKGYEDALQVCGPCRHHQRLNVLSERLHASRKLTLSKLFHSRPQDGLIDNVHLPNINSNMDPTFVTEQTLCLELEVTDGFHRLGPLSVFSAKRRWTAPRLAHLCTESLELGFYLEGDEPVQVCGLDPFSPAVAAGLREGDYVVAVRGVDCKWKKAMEVMSLLQQSIEVGVAIQVISMIDSGVTESNNGSTRCCNLPKTYSLICVTHDYKDKASKTRNKPKKKPFLSLGVKSREKISSALSMSETT